MRREVVWKAAGQPVAESCYQLPATCYQLPATSELEIDLGAELDHPSTNRLKDVEPRGAVPFGHGEDVARVEQVREIDVAVGPHTAEPEALAEPEIHLLHAGFIQGQRWDQEFRTGLVADGNAGGAARQVSAQ